MRNFIWKFLSNCIYRSETKIYFIMKNSRILLILKVSLIFIIIGSFTLLNERSSPSKPLLIFPKGSSYEKEWAKVDSLQKKGLTRSSLDIVNGILEKAREDNNSAQIVKALIHRVKLNSNIEEDSYVKAISELQSEADRSMFPLKQVLHSITADIYWRYYQNNRWKFYNRTETIDFTPEDIRTWDLKKLLFEVIRNYELSLEAPEDLKRTPVTSFDDVLVKETNTRKYRPMLYDFLAHRAIDFFMNEEPDITRPAYKFELDKENYFNDAPDFVKLKLTTKDSVSLKFRAITVLQELLAFHLEDANPEALIDVDLKRLKFVRNQSVVETKDSLYFKALTRLGRSYADHKVSAEVTYEIATLLNEWGSKYTPLTSDDYKWEKKKAVEICEKAIEKYPESFGATNCNYLLALIRQKALAFTTDQVAIPEKHFIALLKFKNIDKVYFRIVKLDYDKYRKTIRKKYGKKLIDYYKTLDAISEWSAGLDNDGDYQQHAVELKMPELAKGHYIIMVATDKDFTYNENAIAYSSCWI